MEFLLFIIFLFGIYNTILYLSLILMKMCYFIAIVNSERQLKNSKSLDITTENLSFLAFGIVLIIGSISAYFIRQNMGV